MATARPLGKEDVPVRHGISLEVILKSQVGTPILVYGVYGTRTGQRVHVTESKQFAAKRANQNLKNSKGIAPQISRGRTKA